MNIRKGDTVLVLAGKDRGKRGVVERIERTKRGTKSRPTVKDTVAYRNHVDEQMLGFLDSLSERSDAETVLSLVRLGLEHEMQHQELLVYDIKHLLCDQYDAPVQSGPASSAMVEGMAEIAGGLFSLGYGSKAQSPKSKDQSPNNRRQSQRLYIS